MGNTRTKKVYRRAHPENKSLCHVSATSLSLPGIGGSAYVGVTVRCHLRSEVCLGRPFWGLEFESGVPHQSAGCLLCPEKCCGPPPLLQKRCSTGSYEQWSLVWGLPNLRFLQFFFPRIFGLRTQLAPQPSLPVSCLSLKKV